MVTKIKWLYAFWNLLHRVIFLNKLWPDLNKSDLIKIIEKYKISENLENKLNRLFVGIIISSLVLISYYFDLDSLFFSFISLLILFECFSLKIFNKNFYFFIDIYFFFNKYIFIFYWICSYICVIINFILIITTFSKKKLKYYSFFTFNLFNIFILFL